LPNCSLMATVDWSTWTQQHKLPIAAVDHFWHLNVSCIIKQKHFNSNFLHKPMSQWQASLSFR
jgi:hypothetical protein